MLFSKNQEKEEFFKDQVYSDFFKKFEEVPGSAIFESFLPVLFMMFLVRLWEEIQIMYARFHKCKFW